VVAVLRNPIEPLSEHGLVSTPKSRENSVVRSAHEPGKFAAVEQRLRLLWSVASPSLSTYQARARARSLAGIVKHLAFVKHAALRTGDVQAQ
jgi:hypothetical protein